jgi:hypothetical protein
MSVSQQNLLYFLLKREVGASCAISTRTKLFYIILSFTFMENRHMFLLAFEPKVKFQPFLCNSGWDLAHIPQ